MSNSSSSTTSHGLSCMYQNVRGLNTKTDSFYRSVCESDYDIIAITESWIQDNIFSSELFDDRYSVFRCDRNLNGMGVSRGGGVILAIKKELKPIQVDLQVVRDSVVKVDMVCSKLFLNYNTLYVLVLYIPPHITNAEFSSLLECVEALSFMYGNNLFIIGDFNDPNFTKGAVGDMKAEMLGNFMNLLALEQFNNILNGNDSVLDLVFSNINCTVHREQFPLVDEDSHHPPLDISLSLKVKSHNVPVNLSQTKYNFRKANFPKLYERILNIDWLDLYILKDVDEACGLLYRNLFGIFDVCVPKSVIRKRTFPVWFTADIIKGIKRKHRIFRKLKYSHSDCHRREFNELRRNVKLLIDLAYKNYISKVEDSITDDPTTFWSFIKAKKSATYLPDVLKLGNLQFSEPDKIADAFAGFFGSVYSTPSDRVPKNDVFTSNLCIALDCLPEQTILTALKGLRDKLTCGPDNIPSFIVKDCAHALLLPLSYIFNLSLKTNRFPDVWKKAKIIPVFKKGDANDISNYRPVSLLPIFAKVFEMSVYQCIFAQVKSLISVNQHGFFSKRSTISNLACFAQFTGNALDKRMQVDAVYNDFSKAFDRVDHSIFLHKLDRLGFSNNLITFFESYLCNRLQYVEIRGHKSSTFSATSGAPQGSNLAPLIFSLFINDIGDNITSNFLLFADDLKLFRTIRDSSDCLSLQHDMESLQQWCELNRLPLNAGKCFFLTYSNKFSTIDFQYKLDNEDITRCNTFKDLGIIFDPKLSFAHHINWICTTAMRTLGFIIRNSSGFHNSKTLKTLYSSYVLSRLEYGAVVWNPIHAKYIKQVENIQRKFAKFLILKYDGVYPDRGVDEVIITERFQLPLLTNRRNYHLVCFLIKLCKSLIDSPDLLFQVNFHVPNRLVRTSPVFCLPTASTNFLIKTPLFQAMSVFNSTCNDIDVNNLSFAQFAKCLKNKLLHV